MRQVGKNWLADLLVVLYSGRVRLEHIFGWSVYRLENSDIK